MTAPSACPDPDRVAAFRNGTLDPADSVAVGEHLDSCSACGLRYADLDGGGDLVSNLRRFLGREPKAIRGGASDAAGPATEASPLALPARLGKYLLTEELGRGGMGVVYGGVHTTLNKRVAVKMILPEYLDHPRVVARFRREVRAVGELAHPNVVAATDAEDAEDRPFLVMERVDGLDLATALRRVGPFPVAAACEVVRQAADGLQYVHERGRVHRDIKPSNLMLARDGVVKILDLGLAVLRADALPNGDLTGSRQMMGTADYTAPEQWADSRGVDIRADVYSLGCTLFHLLAGRAPFTGPAYLTLARKQLAHAEADPPSVRAGRPDVAEGLDAILRRMLAKRPDDRFPTPAAVAEALAPFAAGGDARRLVAEAIDACAPQWVAEGSAVASAETATHLARTPALATATAVPPVRRRRLAGWAAGLVGLVGLAGLAVALSAWPPGRPPDPPRDPVPPTPTPVPSPPVVEDRPVPGKWFQALRREPDKLLWDDVKRDHVFSHDADARQLNVVVPAVSLLGFGRTENLGYRIQVYVSQTRWVGGVGLFFGHHDTAIAGHPCRKCQVIELRVRNAGAERNGFVVNRHWMTVETKGGRPQVTRQVEIASAGFDTPTPVDRPHVLALEVNRNRLIDVRWDDKPFPTLVGEELEVRERLTAADYVGAFGAFNRRSQARFGDAQVLLYERGTP